MYNIIEYYDEKNKDKENKDKLLNVLSRTMFNNLPVEQSTFTYPLYNNYYMEVAKIRKENPDLLVL